MADLKEVKSRIRVKRGPKTKMSGVTLSKGTPFYNETDNTLLISDGVTELSKHDTLIAELANKSKTSVPQVNIDEVLDNWTKSNHGQGGIISADTWDNYIKGVYKNSKYTNFMQDSESGELYFNPLNTDDNKYKVEIKKELFSGTFGGATSDPGSLTLEDVDYMDTLEIWIRWTAYANNTILKPFEFTDRKVITCKGSDSIDFTSIDIGTSGGDVAPTITQYVTHVLVGIVSPDTSSENTKKKVVKYVKPTLLKTEQTTTNGNTSVKLNYYDSGLLYPVITKIYKVIQ